jgi:hypothetical protein
VSTQEVLVASSPEEFTGDDDAVAAALAAAEPAVRVVHGQPDDVELAALVAGIVAARVATAELAGVPDETAEPVRTRWADRARVVGAPPAPGPGSWRWSLHP